VCIVTVDGGHWAAIMGDHHRAKAWWRIANLFFGGVGCLFGLGPDPVERETTHGITDNHLLEEPKPDVSPTEPGLVPKCRHGDANPRCGFVINGPRWEGRLSLLTENGGNVLALGAIFTIRPATQWCLGGRTGEGYSGYRSVADPSNPVPIA
jgi:hypothetical protein